MDMDMNTNMEAEVEVKKKKKPSKKKKTIIIIAAIILAVLLIVGAVFLIIANLPQNVAISAITGFADDLLAREELKPLAEMAEKGSLEFSVKDIQTSDGYAPIGDTSISGKMYFSKDAFMLKGLKLTSGGIDVKGDVYVSNEMIYVKEDEILEGTYGVKFEDLADDLEDSIFAPDSGSMYALEEEVFDMLVSVAESTENSKDARADAEKLTETVVKDLWDIVVEHAEIEAEYTSTRLNGKKTNVRLVSIVIDDDAMVAIIEDAYEYLCDSEDIKDFLEKYGSGLSDIIGEGDDIVDVYEELLEEYEVSVEMICESIEEDFETITVNIYTPHLTSTLLKLELEVGGDTLFTLDCGEKGIKDTDKVTVEAAGFVLTYNVKTSDDSKYNAVMEVEAYGETVFELSININKKKEAYTITASMGTYEYTVKGDWSQDGDITEFTIDSITSNVDGYESSITMKCSFTIDTDDKIPEPKKNFDTVADITEADIERWMYNIERLYSMDY